MALEEKGCRTKGRGERREQAVEDIKKKERERERERGGGERFAHTDMHEIGRPHV